MEDDKRLLISIFRWYKIGGRVVWGTNNLTRQDLINCRNGMYDLIIDTLNGTEFDPDNNEWVKINGDKE